MPLPPASWLPRRPLVRGALCAFVFLGSACRVPNPDHCLHLYVDSNAYCAAQYPELPYCSPCEGENHGCVAEEPTPESCPAYTPPGASSSETDGSETSGASTTEASTDASADTSG